MQMLGGTAAGSTAGAGAAAGSAAGMMGDAASTGIGLGSLMRAVDQFKTSSGQTLGMNQSQMAAAESQNEAAAKKRHAQLMAYLQQNGFNLGQLVQG